MNNTEDLPDANLGDGLCAASTISTSKCTLRAAVQEANAQNSGTIQLPSGLYQLTISGIDEDAAATGDLDLTGAIEIIGSIDSPGDVIIDATGLNDRVFHVLGTGTRRIRGVTIRNGNATSSCANKCTGGGILNESTNLELLDALVLQNQAPFGAGVKNHFNAGLRVERTVVSENLAGTNGGGIGNNGTLTVVDSSLIGNQAPAGGGGLQISAATGSTTVLRTTLSGNQSPATYSYGDGKGAGIELSGSSGFVMVNSTLSGNETAGSGAAIYAASATAVLRNVTITNNYGNTDADGVGQAGGIYLTGTNDVRLENSILWGNYHGTSLYDCYGAGNGLSSSGYNLIGDCGGLITSTGDITGQDPILAGLADNGGFADTHLPQTGSPVIDAGNPAGCLDETGSSLLVVDQTGYTRHADGDGDHVAICDIGAVEVVPEPEPTLAAFAALFVLSGLAKQRSHTLRRQTGLGA